MGLKSSPDILAISGRAAGDLTISADEGVRIVGVVGELGRGGHQVEASPEFVEFKDIALRSPMIYSKSKVEKLGLFGPELEQEGLGDIDVRGQRHLRTVSDVSPALSQRTEAVRLVLRLLSSLRGDTRGMEARPRISTVRERINQCRPGSSAQRVRVRGCHLWRIRTYANQGDPATDRGYTKVSAYLLTTALTTQDHRHRLLRQSSTIRPGSPLYAPPISLHSLRRVHPSIHHPSPSRTSNLMDQRRDPRL